MSTFIYFLCLSLLTSVSKSTIDYTSLYLSPAILFPDYQNMLISFKIYIYTPPNALSFSSPTESNFFTCLQSSPFVTQNPEEAHLYFVPFSSNLSSRSVGRLIRELRMEFPVLGPHSWRRSFLCILCWSGLRV
ncbi:hypothetical protein OIU77_013543 [Salix suchowensis]|uniref:Uncharacterized protein n=1 Tax=Salix suchowensis TaxID=1278906 RepID=A0ABQ8ZVW5_9ROSI|nr:hypothetical protein OIU77_013543 [Salix suchowensis]